MRSYFAVRLGVCIVVGPLGGTLAQPLAPGIAFGPFGSMIGAQFFVVRSFGALWTPAPDCSWGAACAFLLWLVGLA